MKRMFCPFGRSYIAAKIIPCGASHHIRTTGKPKKPIIGVFVKYVLLFDTKMKIARSAFFYLCT